MPQHRWLAKRVEWDKKFKKQLEKKLRAAKESDRLKAEQSGFLTRDFQGLFNVTRVTW